MSIYIDPSIAASPSDTSAPAAAVAVKLTSDASYIDMRSDTVTKPTLAMRQAMFDAEVGDDVYGDDPTVLKLQETVAKLLGKEKGLFVPSGTMGNLLCALVHCDARGGEMILGSESHVHFYEQGNAAQFGGVHSRIVANQPDGTMNLAEVEAAIRPIGDDHMPLTQLIIVENTHNRCGGKVLPLEYMDSIGALAKKYNLALHVDGARLMNAAVTLSASGITPARLVASADSVSLCLSKGLGAPVGSVIVGNAGFILRAKRLRKALGGGMRQSGVLAAAGLLAVNDMVHGLADDHRRVRCIADAMRSIDGVIVPNAADVHTNLLFVTIDALRIDCTASQLCAEFKYDNMLASAMGDRIRFVTHYMIDDAAMDKAIDIITRVITRHQKK